MNPRDGMVECCDHGPQPATFVCQHLVQSLRDRRPVGFWASGETECPRPDAWCTACEAQVQRTGGAWTDASEAFAGVTLLCGGCYDETQRLNRGA